MNWDAVSAIAEALGATAVVLSLVYVAYQIRQNTKAVRAAEYDSRASTFREIVTDIGKSPDSARIFLEGGRDLGSLDEVENVLFVTMMNNAFRAFENFHYKESLGFVDKQLAESWRNALHAYLAMPGVHEYWGYQKSMYTTRFQSYVQNEMHKITSGDAAPGYRATDVHQVSRVRDRDA